MIGHNNSGEMAALLWLFCALTLAAAHPLFDVGRSELRSPRTALSNAGWLPHHDENKGQFVARSSGGGGGGGCVLKLVIALRTVVGRLHAGIRPARGLGPTLQKVRPLLVTGRNQSSG